MLTFNVSTDTADRLPFALQLQKEEKLSAPETIPAAQHNYDVPRYTRKWNAMLKAGAAGTVQLNVVATTSPKYKKKTERASLRKLSKYLFRGTDKKNNVALPPISDPLPIPQYPQAKRVTMLTLIMLQQRAIANNQVIRMDENTISLSSLPTGQGKD